MTSKRKPYKTYPKEFKLEAVRMMRDSDKPAADITRELGIRRNQISKWAEQLDSKGDTAFGGRGRPRKENQSEVSTLKSENARLKEEVDILKIPTGHTSRH